MMDSFLVATFYSMIATCNHAVKQYYGLSDSPNEFAWIIFHVAILYREYVVKK